ncbi:MAG TPA: hypothetical protein VHX52_05475 [Steroidobacteraceae bacterium]|jgi:hypothetical protein|nr:hypothetical protein [Steroidobacteraceae bacterium]
MLRLYWKSLALGIALGLAALGTAGLHAQNQPDEQRQQSAAPDHRAQPAEQAPSRATPRSNDNAHPKQHVAERGDNDTAANYRRAHPSAAARCHDGFFTKTTDRSRACSKHGGIDVWLRL